MANTFMGIEDKIFQRKRFVENRMQNFVFDKNKKCYSFESDLLNGNFKAILTVDKKGKLAGKVIDKLTNEEYTPLRILGFEGEYVNSVRTAYYELLQHVADTCCNDVLFASDQANRLTKSIIANYSVNPDFPWEQSQYQSYGVFRHQENNKWFALIMNVNRRVLLSDAKDENVDIVNLKIKPETSLVLCEREGIFPGYHMNHKHWISVTLDDKISDLDLLNFLKVSFNLTK